MTVTDVYETEKIEVVVNYFHGGVEPLIIDRMKLKHDFVHIIITHVWVKILQSYTQVLRPTNNFFLNIGAVFFDFRDNV